MMETYAKQSKPIARTLSSRSKQAQHDVAKVLQAYQNRTVQLAELTEEDSTLIQGKFTTQLQGEEELIQQGSENRTGLPDQLKNGVENLSGYNLSAVKVHYNSPKPALLQAYAYTQGTDIHVAPGQERYLPHEAWHVVQQMKGQVQPTAQLLGIAINDNTRLENEADRMGEKATSTGVEKNLKRSDVFSPVTLSYPPIQGGWFSDHRHLITLGLGGLGTVLSALVPGAAPVMSALAGGLDLLKGGYDTYKAATTPRYNLADGEITISRGRGIVEGGKQMVSGQSYTEPQAHTDEAIHGKCVATIEIPENENISCSRLVPEGMDEATEVPTEGEETNLRGDQELITQASKLEAIVPLLTALGGSAGAIAGVSEESGVVAEVLKVCLPYIKMASPTAYLAAGLGDIVERV